MYTTVTAKETNKKCFKSFNVKLLRCIIYYNNTITIKSYKILNRIMIMTIFYLQVLTKLRASSRGNT